MIYSHMNHSYDPRNDLNRPPRIITMIYSHMNHSYDFDTSRIMV